MPFATVFFAQYSLSFTTCSTFWCDWTIRVYLKHNCYFNWYESMYFIKLCDAHQFSNWNICYRIFEDRSRFNVSIIFMYVGLSIALDLSLFFFHFFVVVIKLRLAWMFFFHDYLLIGRFVCIYPLNHGTVILLNFNKWPSDRIKSKLDRKCCI